MEYASGLLVDGAEELPADQFSRTRFDGDSQTWFRVSSSYADYSPQAVELLEQIRDVPGPGTVLVGGPTAAVEDTTERVRSQLPLAAAIIVAGSFLVLVLATGGLLVALKAAVIGFLVWGFQQDHLNGVLGSFQPVDSTDLNALILVLVIIYGLSLDYEVFLLTRVREFHLQGYSGRAAVVEGLARTGGTITSAALIMLVILAGLTTSESLSLKFIGAGLLFAIVLDAFLVRCVMVPALLSMAGRWNWWAPARVHALRQRVVGRWDDVGDQAAEARVDGFDGLYGG